MDNYSRSVLTVIAIALLAITFRIYSPIATVPVYGDLEKVSVINDPELKDKAIRKLFNEIPLVRIQGGNVEVTGEVSIDR